MARFIRLRWCGWIAPVLFVAAVWTTCRPATDAPTEGVPAEGPAFDNLSPDVAHVGSAACRPCHAELYAAYQATGKGHSLYRPHDAVRVEDFAAPPVYDTALDLYYYARWHADSLRVVEFRLRGGDTTHRREERVDWVIGSGRETRSYLRQVNGYTYELPITWYARKGVWDLSPGYEAGANSRFGRPVGAACINCHADGQRFVDGSQNRFVELGEAIGCESCHGAGGAHVARRLDGPPATDSTDRTIVNPRHLSVARQLDVCQQCHLEGIAVPTADAPTGGYRPGLRLDDFQTVLHPTGSGTDDFGFASHAERLRMSACFKNAPRLTCTTCHDPHEPLVAQPRPAYNATCRGCHTADHQTICGVSAAEAHTADANDCVSCHMPLRGPTDIPHVSAHDHFIRPPSETEEDSPTEPSGGVELRPSAAAPAPSNRTLALGYLQYYETHAADPRYLAEVVRYAHTLDRDARIKLAYFRRTPPEPTWTALPLDSLHDPHTCYYLAELM
ncbi:MAG: hypothetical protein WBA12_10585, partial [Catalinimonas sp.]